MLMNAEMPLDNTLVTLSDKTPRVSFDNTLGDRLENKVIEYSPQALGSLLGKMGVDKDNQDITIHIGETEFMIGGYYDPDERRVVVQFSSAKKMNTSLKHELQHHADGVDEISRMYTIGNKAAKLSLPTGYTLMGVGAAEYINLAAGSPVSDEVMLMTIGSLSVANLGMLATSLLYTLDPSERRARKAERMSHPPIFSIDPSV